MKRKIISIVATVCIIISCLSVSISAFATTRYIELNVKTTNILDGTEDMNRYIFTPEISGTYSFLSYNIYASEAYLYVKEKDPVTLKKVFTQLEYSNTSPNWEKNGQPNILQFCLTYHLEAGVTYYFDAGWREDYTYDKARNMTVMLRCDEYDSNVIESIDLSCPAQLSAYTDGYWSTDSNGSQFYCYEISKIYSNMKITVHYSDGSTSTVTGADEIDGHEIVYLHDQTANHWYPQASDEYTANTLTVKIADASAEFDVPIKISAIYSVKGTVVDYAGKPVKNAKIINSNTNTLITSTDSSGKFVCGLNSGLYSITVKNDSSIDRNITMTVSALNNGNDFTEVPIKLATCNYIDDDIINAKDYSFIIKNLTDEELDNQKAQFKNLINFTKEDYEPLHLANSNR